MSTSTNVESAMVEDSQKIRVMRAHTRAHFEAMQALDRQCFIADVEPAKWEKTVWWIAVTATGQVVGYAGARVVTDWNALYLSRAGVHPNYRGRKLQRRLIRARVAHAKRLGLAKCLTYTVPWNPKSVNSLIACGFRYYEPQYAWAGRDVLYFWRPTR